MTCLSSHTVIYYFKVLQYSIIRARPLETSAGVWSSICQSLDCAVPDDTTLCNLNESVWLNTLRNPYSSRSYEAQHKKSFVLTCPQMCNTAARPCIAQFLHVLYDKVKSGFKCICLGDRVMVEKCVFYFWLAFKSCNPVFLAWDYLHLPLVLQNI